MFPQDVVANAPRILSDLRAFFPTQVRARSSIGPMVKLGWGTPTLVSLSVGIIIEIPGNIAHRRRAQDRTAGRRKRR